MSMKLERSHSLPRNRFGQLSKNMFFARHVAQPRYLKFITGAGGQQICCVREEPLKIPVPTLGDFTKPLISDPRFNVEFLPNTQNETLLQSYRDRLYLKKRRERLLAPVPGWNPSGMIVQDTDNWRRELARIGEMVGLVTSDELVEIEARKEALQHVSSPSTPKQTITLGQYSRQSGRWNETPKSAKRSRSLHRQSSAKSVASNQMFCVDEQEREVWMLQVLCQILQTENINDIQSWLVSSGPGEKEAVRQLITKAMKGLEENGRIRPEPEYIDNAKAVQVNLDSFGSLLATRFPCVSSSIPTTPLHRTPSKPLSRARTAPPLHVKEETPIKSADAVPNSLPSIDENTETIVTQPTKVDVQRDIQILTLDDNEPPSEPITIVETQQIPF